MKKRRYLIIILIFSQNLLLLQGEQVLVEKGFINLKGKNLYQNKIFKLEGQWEFYWNQLLEPDDFNENQDLKVDYFPYPGLWNNQTLKNIKLNYYGYATYRVRIAVDPISLPLAVKVHEIPTSYKMWINGKLYIESGEVGTSAKESSPAPKHHFVHFQESTGNIEIVIQVSNFSYNEGGTWVPIKIGSSQVISKLREKEIAFDLLLMGSVLLMGIYHIFLYFLRRNRISPLFFGLFCLIIGIRSLFVGDGGFIFSIVPDISWVLIRRIDHLTFILDFHCLFHL